jgi:NhaP-type Na+/H+ or K+/H+ antiporter
VATWWLINNMEFQVTNYYGLGDPEFGENPYPVKVDIMQILLITALLCSSDVVAAVSIVDYNQQPKLFSCIFGEGVVNDIVSIILFNTILALQSVTFDSSTPFVILFQFVLLGVVSLAIGVLIGFFTSALFKHCGFLRVSAITETFLILALSMASYFLAEMTELAGIRMSGIISLLTCGIVQSHYTYYNLSPQGKICSTLTVGFLGHAAEAGIYSYIGLSLYSNLFAWWSWEFVIYETIVVMVGRYLAVFGTFYAFKLCFKSRTIDARELVFIGWGGMIRGAIAFALVMRIPKQGADSCTAANPARDCFTA